MTNEKPETSMLRLPFVFRFAQPLVDAPRHPLRYDAARQISQVLIDGKWFDTPDASVEPIASTRITKVQSETQDDA